MKIASELLYSNWYWPQHPDIHTYIQCTNTHTHTPTEAICFSMISGIPYSVPRLPLSLTSDTNVSLSQKPSVNTPTPLDPVSASVNLMMPLSDLRWTEGMFLFEPHSFPLQSVWPGSVQGHGAAVQWLTMHHLRMDAHMVARRLALTCRCDCKRAHVPVDMATVHWTDRASLSNMNDAWRFGLEKDKPEPANQIPLMIHQGRSFHPYMQACNAMQAVCVSMTTSVIYNKSLLFPLWISILIHMHGKYLALG